MAVAELAPREKGVEVTSPQINYHAGDVSYGFHWFNTVVRLYGAEHDSYAKYFDGKESKVMLPDSLREKLLDEKFPFSYFPTPSVERHWRAPQGLTDNYRIEHYDPMNVELGNESFDLRWSNTVIRVFGEPEYNHIEVRQFDDKTKTHNVRGMFVHEDVMKHLFENDYPIIYFPTVEMDSITKKWFENRKA